MNKSGFSLVELLIATLIASLLGSLLISAVYQMNRAVPIIDTRSDVYEKAAIVNAQLERDLSGVIAPNEYYARQKNAPKEEKEKPAEQDQKKKAEQDKAAKEKAAAQEEKGEEKPKKPLEKIFYGTNKEGAFDQLTFITTNPLQVYWSAKAGVAKPRMARVMYKLEEEKPSGKTAKKSYRLIRQETNNLEADGLKDASEQILADGIKSLTVEYTAIISEQEKKEAAQKEAAEKKKKKEIKKSADWLGKKSEEGPAAAAQETDKSKLPLVPQVAEFNIAFWDAQKKRSIPFSFKTMIRSEIPEKRQDGSPKILEKLKDLMGQAFPQDNAPQKVAQQSPSFSMRGPVRR